MQNINNILNSLANIPIAVTISLVGLIIIIVFLLDNIRLGSRRVKIVSISPFARGIGVAVGVGIILFALLVLRPIAPTNATADTSCYSQKQAISPITISQDTIDTQIFVSSVASCQDINFQPTGDDQDVQVRVVFRDPSTNQIKSPSGQWKTIGEKGTWMVLASQVIKGTHYSLEFLPPSDQREILGNIAA